MVAGFQALAAVGIWKIRLIEKTNIEKEIFYVSEKIFEMIKKWGTIDYEEYWNRNSYNTWILNGHYSAISGFWNFWDNGTMLPLDYGDEIYHCISNGGGATMWTGWCLVDNNQNFDLNSINDSYYTSHQRYTQYERQFIDRNSDNDDEGCSRIWDEDCDGSIVWDDDDFFIGMWPEAFSWAKVPELYLINSAGNERTYFRWSFALDTEYAPAWSTCSWTDTMTWTWCLWTIEFLKLQWKDYGFNHDNSINLNDGSQYDGIIDTWIIHPDFVPDGSEVIAGSNTDNYWQPALSDSISVTALEFYAYPNKSLEYSWRDDNEDIFLSPYVQIKMTIEPSWKQKRKIKWAIPSMDFVSTIQLSDLDFR